MHAPEALNVKQVVHDRLVLRSGTIRRDDAVPDAIPSRLTKALHASGDLHVPQLAWRALSGAWLDVTRSSVDMTQGRPSFAIERL